MAQREKDKGKGMTRQAKTRQGILLGARSSLKVCGLSLSHK
jgi:hypothetical protein